MYYLQIVFVILKVQITIALQTGQSIIATNGVDASIEHSYTYKMDDQYVLVGVKQ